MRVAIYARVSTSDQHNEIQVRELTEYAQRRGWELAGVYQDHMSGAKTKRPGLDQLMGTRDCGSSMQCWSGSWIDSEGPW
jgi:DNA invertase Pin-like site-specific DNA recombinase